MVFNRGSTEHKSAESACHGSVRDKTLYLSAASSFIANAHNDRYAFYTEKAAFWKKSEPIGGGGAAPTTPFLESATAYGWFGVAVTVFGNGVRHINEVKLRRARLVLGLVNDLWRVYHPGIYSGPLSLAIPSWVGAMSTVDGFGHLWEEMAPLKLRPYGAL